MSKQSFGKNIEGQEVFLYTLENDAVKVSISDYGATMVSFVNKKTGVDILLGFDRVEGYIAHKAHLGAFIGRTANRIANAEFELNGQVYHLGKNSGENNLHGGDNGFDKRMFEAHETNHSVVFHRISPDGEEGFPGYLDVTVTYTLLSDGIELKAEGKAMNQDTLFAMTNHNYYNLEDSDSIRNHIVRIPAEQYAKDSPDGISQLPLLPVEGTPFDFRKEKKLGQDFECDDPQIQANRGYDHHWAIDGEGMRTFAECTAGGTTLIIESDMPGMHMYTSNFLEAIGKNNTPYHMHAGVCFEPEYFPNGINLEGVKKPILRANETSVQTMRMRIR